MLKITLCCPVPREGWGPGDLHYEDEFRELQRFLAEPGDILVFPEGFLRTENLERACALVREGRKWVVLGTDGPADSPALETVIIRPDGEIALRHVKTAVTNGDVKNGFKRGDSYEVCETPWGVIAPVLCYEIHFPEIARIVALAGAKLLINCIGTGMWHEQQYSEWTTIARARAIENRVFVVGCSHFCDGVPLMYGFGPDGNTLGILRNTNGCLTFEIDFSQIKEQIWIEHRTPHLYGALLKPNGTEDV